MPRVYGVQDDDQKVSGWMSEDDTVSPPTGETAVLESTIRAADPPGAEGRIQSGGKWDGTSYTAPVGDEFYQPYDTSTELGELQAAAVLAHDALVDWEGTSGQHRASESQPHCGPRCTTSWYGLIPAWLKCACLRTGLWRIESRCARKR